jgi:hypothetical protein
MGSKTLDEKTVLQWVMRHPNFGTRLDFAPVTQLFENELPTVVCHDWR